MISDPGYLLVDTVIKQKLPFTIIPGPSAAITAILHSGFKPSQFMFLGFLPRKPSQILHYINKMESVKKILPDCVFVIYESPQRINSTLKLIGESSWDPDIVVCREMTKKFEEVLRGKASELMEKQYKGEITLLIK